MIARPLDGRYALMAGAASGIGRAAAILLAERGARAIVADIGQTGGEALVVVEICRAGGEGIAADCDVTNNEAAAVALATGTLGPLDCAFDNAGVFLDDDAIWDEAAFDRRSRSIAVKKAEIPAMLESGGASQHGL